MKNLLTILTLGILVFACCKKKKSNPAPTTPLVAKKDSFILGNWRLDSLTDANNTNAKTNLIDTIYNQNFKTKYLSIDFCCDSLTYTPSSYHKSIVGLYHLYESNKITLELYEVENQVLHIPPYMFKSDLQPLFIKSLNASLTYQIFNNGTKMQIVHSNGQGIAHFTKL